MKEQVKNMSAEAIGEAMLPYLSQWTLLHIIDTVIKSGLPSFHPSQWEGRIGQEVLTPLKVISLPKSKKEYKPVKRFEFTFSKTDQEVQAEAEEANRKAFKTRNELRDGFTKTIRQQLNQKTWLFIKSIWANIQAHIDDFIERQFPTIGPKIKRVLDKICRRIFFDFIGFFLRLGWYPINYIINLIETIHINKRSDEIIENLHISTFEDLVYKWIESTLNILLRMKNHKQALEGV
jgi:hypothetical protein